MYLIYLISVGVIALDQLSKIAIVRSMTLYETIPVIKDIFHITYTKNKGVAFSMLSNIPDAFRVHFFALTTGAVIALIIWFFRGLIKESGYVRVCFGLIIGGALGNFIDRVRIGEVIDFIEVGLNQNLKWPIFNVADSCINIGVVMLLIYLVRNKESAK